MRTPGALSNSSSSLMCPLEVYCFMRCVFVCVFSWRRSNRVMELFPEQWQLSALLCCCFSDCVDTAQVRLFKQEEACMFKCVHAHMCKWLVYLHVCMCTIPYMYCTSLCRIYQPPLSGAISKAFSLFLSLCLSLSASQPIQPL